MYFDRNVFCFIFARGGSKGIPRKNVKKLHGKPLICYSILTAKNVKYIDEIFVSSEDEEIKNIASEFQITVIDRPKKLASDMANFLDSVKHLFSTIEKIKEDNPIIVILLPTSPIRKTNHIEECIKLFDATVDCVVSISKVKYHPSKFLKISNDGLLEFYLNEKMVPNRQQEETLYAANGSIVISDYRFLSERKNSIFEGRIKGFVMDQKHSWDIDTEFDFQVAEKIFDYND